MSLQVLVVLLELHPASGVLAVLQVSKNVSHSAAYTAATQAIQRSQTFWVVYREGVCPSPRASVHSSVTMQRTPFFLAMQVT